MMNLTSSLHSLTYSPQMESKHLPFERLEALTFHLKSVYDEFESHTHHVVAIDSINTHLMFVIYQQGLTHAHLHHTSAHLLLLFHKMFEELMGLLQLFFKFGFTFFGVFTKHGHSTFELTCCIKLKINMMFFQ